MPEAGELAKFRRAIDRHPSRLKAALKHPRVRRDFLKDVAAEDAKVVKQFIAQNSENALKTKPKVSSHFSNISISLLYM
jgi:hypothetical protein